MDAQKSMALYSAVQLRELDRRAIEDHGIPAYTLMQRAAEAAHALIQDKWSQARQILLLCGVGNNGGDALVLARLLSAAGLQERVLMLCEPTRLGGAAQQAFTDYAAAGGQVLSVATADVGRLLAEADAVVDGLFGTGLSRPVTGQYEQLIRQLAEVSGTTLPVLALDIPSGLNADTGAVMGVAVKASVTLSFIGEKLGLHTGSGVDYVGEVAFSDLEVPANVYQHMQAQALRIDDGLRIHSLSPRNRTAHKGHNGRALCVGGDYGTAGAIRLAAEATLRCGAGLVSVGTRTETASAMAQARPELMAKGLSEPNDLRALLEGKSVLLIGPGLGQGEWGKGLLSVALTTQCPLVVDADALNMLAGSGLRRDNWILTPHPGEAARLLGCSSTDIQADRPAAVEALIAQYGGTVVLKGPGTLVKHTGGDLHVCTAGNPGMAVGGMGDVLAGVIAGLVAQGLALDIAARLGVYLHARAADEAAAALGERGLLPSDLWPWLRQLINP